MMRERVRDGQPLPPPSPDVLSVFFPLSLFTTSSGKLLRGSHHGRGLSSGATGGDVYNMFFKRSGGSIWMIRKDTNLARYGLKGTSTLTLPPHGETHARTNADPKGLRTPSHMSKHSRRAATNIQHIKHGYFNATLTVTPGCQFSAQKQKKRRTLSRRSLIVSDRTTLC